MINDEFKNKPLEQKTQLLKSILNENVCEVTFTKVNGEVRIMPCTLKHDLLPKQDVITSTKSKTKTTDVLSVWCIDQIGWRSFRIDNIIGIKII